MKKQVFAFLLCGLCSFSYAQEIGGQLLAIISQDAWKLEAVYQPAEAGQKTAVLLHDMGKSHQDFAAFSSKLAAQGIGYVALDLRGHGKSTNKGGYRYFAKEGVDNEYNMMTRDVNAAVEVLKGKGLSEEDILFIGVGMGANVAAKAVSLWPNIGGVALITPVTNFRDVLPIPSLRIYKGPVFIGAAADDKKTFLEASVMRNVAFLSSGEGNVTFATAYDKKGHELLDTWLTGELLQWIQTPQRPPLSPDIIEEKATDQESGAYEQVESSATEEALFPSILQ